MFDSKASIKIFFWNLTFLKITDKRCQSSFKDSFYVFGRSLVCAITKCFFIILEVSISFDKVF